MSESIIRFLGQKLRVSKQMIERGNLDEELMDYYQGRKQLLEGLIQEYLIDEGGLHMEFSEHETRRKRSTN